MSIKSIVFSLSIAGASAGAVPSASAAPCNDATVSLRESVGQRARWTQERRERERRESERLERARREKLERERLEHARNLR